MKKIPLALGFTTVALLTGSVSAAMAGWMQGLKPYVGADAQVRRMDFKGGYGDNLLQHHSPQGNLYAGVRVNEFMGFEAGYEATTTRTRTATLTTGDIESGVPIASGLSPIIFKSKMKLKGPHVDLVGFYPLGGAPVELLGSVGVSFFKATVERRTLQMGTPPMVGTANRTLSRHKAVLRLMGGLQYWWNCNLGIRGTIGLVKTDKLIISANDNTSGSITPTIKPKNSLVYGLGLSWSF